jgi:hypothetical protein
MGRQVSFTRSLASIVTTPKQTLRQLEKAAPGTRFERLYQRRQQGRHARWMNAAFNVGGLLVIAAGFATYPIPVIPSEIVILIGLGLISQGSLRGAKILDATEVRLRRWFAPAIKVWKRWPKWLRRSLGVAWMVGVAALSYWAYRAIAD